MEEVQQLSASAVCCDCLFEFTALYFLLVHLLERSADGLRLAVSTVGIETLFGTELGPQCLISCYPDCERLRRQ